MGVLYNLQKFRFRVQNPYRSDRSSGYCGPGAQNSQKFRSGMKTLYRYPGYCETGHTELTEVRGTGMKVVQNSHSFGYGYKTL